MATTYGYGGEFSSDEDIDKLEQQQSEQMVQAKFDNNSRPGKRQIEDLISSIKSAPYDQEFQLSDDLLAGLLDYYKTPRGPIVDSTRKLYHKIVLRLIRDDQPQAADDTATNGNSDNQNGTNINNNNNNSINIIQKPQQQTAEAFSSDDDEPVVVMSKKKFDSRVVYTDNDENKMEVDSETPSGPPRETKQVDLSSSEDESDSSHDSEDSDESESESDVLDATPIKPTVSQSREKEGVQALMDARPSTPRQPESSMKRQQPLAHSTPKETPAAGAKKPYTRSQRVATRSATRSNRASDVSNKSSGSAVVPNTSADAFIESKQTSSGKKYAVIAVSLLVIVLAVLFFYFKSNISQSAKPLISFWWGPKAKL